MNKYARFSKVVDWHLNRMCRHKAAFDSKEEAYQKGQDSYKCTLCGKWHRTSIIKPRKRKLRGFSLGSGS